MLTGRCSEVFWFKFTSSHSVFFNIVFNIILLIYLRLLSGLLTWYFPIIIWETFFISIHMPYVPYISFSCFDTNNITIRINIKLLIMFTVSWYFEYVFLISVTSMLYLREFHRRERLWGWTCHRPSNCWEKITLQLWGGSIYERTGHV